MNNKIINSNIAPGDCFVGMVNGELFTVTKIYRNPTVYGTESGRSYCDSNLWVQFMSIFTGKICECNYDHAKRLLLRKVTNN